MLCTLDRCRVGMFLGSCTLSSLLSSLLFSSSHLLSSDGGMIRIGTLATCVPAGHELSRLVPSYLAVGTEDCDNITCLYL